MRVRLLALGAAVAGALALSPVPDAAANHGVLLEGNCDSPVPGTTLVSPGTCGDFDGDGRIGTAEDTDGADRIFGTLRAALGPGTGAAAGTGANFNGRISIVTDGRFAEVVDLTPASTIAPNPPAPNFGNITIEAAEGVSAVLDAVFQGDPAGGNNTRQAASGITIDTPATSVITLRNLTVRNWTTGLSVLGSSRVTVDDVRFENNANFGIRVEGASQVAITDSDVTASGFRVGTGAPPVGGFGISFEGTSSGIVHDTDITNNLGAGISRSSTGSVDVKFDSLFGNSPNAVGV